MLSQRLISAAIGIPLIVLIVWLGGAVLAAVVAIAVFVAVIEIAAARDVAGTPFAILTGLLGSLIPLAALEGGDWFTGSIVAVILITSTAFIFSPQPRHAVEGWLWGVATALYFGALAGHFVLLRELEDGRDWLFFALITVWVADTGAYAVGRWVGSHKLAPAISPGKTIEGALGQVLTGVIAVFAIDAILGLDLALEHRIALGLLLPAVALAGDLAESAIKRALDIKDSSAIVPGHGGIADRLDSLLFAVPVLYYYLSFTAF